MPALLAGNAVVIKPSELTPLGVRRAVEAMQRVLPRGRAAGRHRRRRDGRGAGRPRRHDLRHRLAGDRAPRDGAGQPPADARAARARRQGPDDRAARRRPRPRRARRRLGRVHDDRAGLHVGRARLRRGAGRRGVHARSSSSRCGRCASDRTAPDADIDFGAFTSPRQIEIVERHVEDARAKGARVLTGGRRYGERTRALLRAHGARGRRPLDARSCARRRSAPWSR